MESKAPAGSELLARTHELLDSLLPSEWRLRQEDADDGTTDQPDMVLELEAPDGGLCRLAIEAKSPLNATDAQRSELRLRGFLAGQPMRDRSVAGVIAAPYINPSRRQWIADHDLGFIDITGNVRINVRKPSVLIIQQGADRNPWPSPHG